MPTTPSDPIPQDFADAADKSVAAGIADETAGYDRAVAEDDDAGIDPAEGGTE